jgi:AcrR family transcriptional regulator
MVIKEDILKAMTERLVQTTILDIDAAALAVKDLTAAIPELAEWLDNYPTLDIDIEKLRRFAHFFGMPED